RRHRDQSLDQGRCGQHRLVRDGGRAAGGTAGGDAEGVSRGGETGAGGGAEGRVHPAGGADAGGQSETGGLPAGGLADGQGDESDAPARRQARRRPASEAGRQQGRGHRPRGEPARRQPGRRSPAAGGAEVGRVGVILSEDDSKASYGPAAGGSVTSVDRWTYPSTSPSRATLHHPRLSESTRTVSPGRRTAATSPAVLRRVRALLQVRAKRRSPLPPAGDAAATVASSPV